MREWHRFGVSMELTGLERVDFLMTLLREQLIGRGRAEGPLSEVVNRSLGMGFEEISSSDSHANLTRGSTLRYRLLGTMGPDGGTSRFPVSLRLKSLDGGWVFAELEDRIGPGVIYLISAHYRLFGRVLAELTRGGFVWGESEPPQS